MRAVLRVLLSRWLLSFVGVALLAVLVWVFGPLLDWFEPVWPRATVIVVMLLIWAGTNAALDWRRRRRARRLTEGLTEGEAAPGAEPAVPAQARQAEEAAAISEKLSTALALLKKAAGTRGYLYEQPWYVLIGPPGAGKTTALLNAGLNFPLARELGQAPVPGVGGTRLCDWWFTETAVLIDTAGRFTTQDSDVVVDRAGWEAFLSLLKSTRPRQPLNGVLVAISLRDVAESTAAERRGHANAVRARIKDLQEKLGVRLPVYALLTKSDLIAGFTEFFDDLDREKRDQVWGVTFPLTGPGETAVGTFPERLQELVGRLDERLYERLQAERSPERRTLIAGFPTQVASLAQPLSSFLTEAFGGSRLDPPPLLRGVYFTSGTQEGTPLDRLTGAIARSFGLDQQSMPSLRPVRGRSYFLGRLIRDVVLGEAMLVREPPGAARRRVLLRSAAYAAVALLTLAASGALYAARQANDDGMSAFVATLAAYEAPAKATRFDPVNDADLLRLAPLLDRARALPAAAGSATSSWLPGLSQRSKLEAGGADIYRRALAYALFPRIIWRLETQMRGGLTRPDFLYEATRVYLMLGGQSLDRALVHEWLSVDWSNTYPGAINAPVVRSLLTHLDSLLAQPLPPVTLDGALVAEAQAAFAGIPVATRVYSRIKPSPAARAVPPWVPAEVLGGGSRLFLRSSGRPLTEGIPGFLTLDGFYKALLPALPGAVREVASESWVLGKRAEIKDDQASRQALEQQVIQLYVRDYITAWDGLLNDINPVPLRSVPQAAQDLFILPGPMRDLLNGVARQVTLSVPPAPQGVQGAVQNAAQGAVQQAAAATNSVRSQVLSALGQSGQQAAGPPPGWEVDQHFKPLRDLMAGGPAAPFEQMLKPIGDLQQQLAKQAAQVASGNAGQTSSLGGDPAIALRTEAARQPPPVSRWLLDMATAGTALRAGGMRQQVAAAYNSSTGPAALCPLAVNGRFPFAAGSSLDTPMDDFAKLFAPGGLLDGFFNTELRPFVDTSDSKQWKPQPADGVPPPVSAGDVAQFQRAAVIRDLFFGAGGATPSVRFDITPINADAGTRQVTLDFDGTPVTYAQGPPRATAITWPGPTRTQNMRLVFDPPSAGQTGVLSDAGPWAMFRMFGRGKLTQGASPEQFQLTFSQGERSVTYELRAASVRNPFAPGLLQDFKCPTVQ